MPDARVIKKYPNRRLYDTEKSRYIKLADVRTLVLEDVHFVVVDQKTGDDITRNILLQVISEQEQQGEAIMSRAFLSGVIRAYGRVSAAATAGYLEQCLDGFVRRGWATGLAVADVAQMRRGWWTTPPGEPEDRPGEAESACYAEDRKKAG